LTAKELLLVFQGERGMPISITALDKPILVEPETPAPADGSYEEVDGLGRATGVQTAARKGERLPSTRHGYRWRLRAQ
jgi:hypothetical protein